MAPVETPLGVMLLGATEGKLCLAEFGDPARLEAQLRRVRQRLGATLVPGREAPAAAEAQLMEYFAGLRRRFDLPLSLAGTDLQRQVWETLPPDPYYETLSRRLKMPLPGPLTLICGVHRLDASRSGGEQLRGKLYTKLPKPRNR